MRIAGGCHGIVAEQCGPAHAGTRAIFVIAARQQPYRLAQQPGARREEVRIPRRPVIPPRGTGASLVVRPARRLSIQIIAHMNHEIGILLRGVFGYFAKWPEGFVVAILHDRSLEPAAGVPEHHHMARLGNRNGQVSPAGADVFGPGGNCRDADANGKRRGWPRAFAHRQRSAVGDQGGAGRIIGDQTRLDRAVLAILAPGGEYCCPGFRRKQNEQGGEATRCKGQTRQNCDPFIGTAASIAVGEADSSGKA